METKKIEKVSYEYVYVAADGTEFVDKDECLKYDKSAKGVLAGRVKRLAVYEGNEDDLFSCGWCDNGAMVVVPKSLDDIALLRQFIILAGDNTVDYAARLGDDQVGKPVVLFAGYENDGCWFTTLDQIVNTATGGKYEVVEKKSEASE